MSCSSLVLLRATSVPSCDGGSPSAQAPVLRLGICCHRHPGDFHPGLSVCAVQLHPPRPNSPPPPFQGERAGGSWAVEIGMGSDPHSGIRLAAVDGITCASLHILRLKRNTSLSSLTQIALVYQSSDAMESFSCLPSAARDITS